MKRAVIATAIAFLCGAGFVVGVLGADLRPSLSDGLAAPLERLADRAVGYREVTVPAGTLLPLRLESYVASDSSRIEDPVRAEVRRPIVIDGRTVIPAGSTVVGQVTSARRPGRVKGVGHIAFRFSSLTLADTGDRMNIRTSAVARSAPATKKRDAAKIGLPAAGGAIIGALTGGKKGAAIGAAAGGGAGTAIVLSTRGKEVRMGRGALVAVRLLEPVTLRVRERLSE